VSTFWVLKVLSEIKFESINAILAFFPKPFNSLSILPETMLFSVFGSHKINAKSMLLSEVPVALILPTILPLIDTKAMLFVFHVLS